MIRNKDRTKVLVGVGRMAAVRYNMPDEAAEKGYVAKNGTGIYVADGEGGYKKPTYTFGCYERPYGMVMASAPYLRGQMEIEGKVTPADCWVRVSYINYPTYSVTEYRDQDSTSNDVMAGNGRTDGGFSYRSKYIRAGEQVFFVIHGVCARFWATRDDTGAELQTLSREVHYEYADGTPVTRTQYYFIMPDSNVHLHGTFAAGDPGGELPGIEEAAAELAEAPVVSAAAAPAAAEPEDIPILERPSWVDKPMQDPRNATPDEIRERVYYYQNYVVDGGLTDEQKEAMRSGPYYGRDKNQPGRIFPEFYDGQGADANPNTTVLYHDGRIKPNSDGTFRFNHSSHTEGWVYVWVERPPTAVGLAACNMSIELVQFPDPEVEEDLKSGTKQFIWTQTNYAVAEEVAALGELKDEEGNQLSAEQIASGYFPAVCVTGTAPPGMTRVYLWRIGESTVWDYKTNPFELLGYRTGPEIYDLLFNQGAYPAGSAGSGFVDWAVVKDGRFELYDYRGDWGTKDYNGVWDGTHETNLGRYLVFGIGEQSEGAEITAQTEILRTAEGLLIGTVCLNGDTLITMADGSTRPLRELHFGDQVLSGSGEATGVISVSRGRMHHYHTLYTFDDGTVIDESADHRFYNVNLGYWAWLRDWRIGDRARKVDGSTTALVNRERVDEPAECFGLWTESRDYWAGGLLSGETMANQRLLADASAELAAEMLGSIEPEMVREMMGGDRDDL